MNQQIKKGIHAVLVAASLGTAPLAYGALDSLDTTFGQSGRTLVDLGSEFDETTGSVVLDSQGNVYVIGHISSTEQFVIRVTSAGAVDTTFSGDGMFPVPSACGMEADSIAVDAEASRVYLAGTAKAEPFGTLVCKLDFSGAPDTSFSGDGVAPVSGVSGFVSSIVLANDGKIVMGGEDFGNVPAFVARMNADGSPDTSFDGGRREVHRRVGCEH